MHFFTTVYDHKYIPMLIAFLHSIHKTEKDYSGTVIYQNLIANELQNIKNAYPKIKFFKSKYSISNYTTSIERIPLKLKFWCEFFELQTTPNNQIICLCDCDTLILKPIENTLQDKNFDLIFTWKEHKFPINTGVIIVKNSTKIFEFFKLWLNNIEKIIPNKKEVLRTASKFGAIDQFVLLDLMEPSTFESKFIRPYSFGDLTFFPQPCSIYNEVFAIDPLNCKTVIVHYKTSWHPLLLQQNPKLVPGRHTSSQLNYWKELYKEAKIFINRQKGK